MTSFCRRVPARPLFAGGFLHEPCGPTRPAPAVPFFSKRKEPKIRQRGGFLFGFSSEGHIPSGTSPCEVLSPCLLRWQANVRFCSYYFGQSVVMPSVRSTVTEGDQRGSCPFVKFFKLLRSRNQVVPCVLFVKLSSHKKVSAGVGRVGPQIGSAGTALQKTLQKVRRRSCAPSHACAGKRMISQDVRVQA